MSIALDIGNDLDLLTLLMKAEPHDLDVLVNVLTDNGKGRLSLSSSSKAALLDAGRLHRYDEDVIRLIISELQLFGGNSVVNLIRGNGVEYRTIVTDVADSLGLKVGSDESLLSAEGRILTSLCKKAWERMDEEERQRYRDDFLELDSGLYSFATILKIILGRGTNWVMGLAAAPSLLRLVASGIAGRAALGGAASAAAGVALLAGWGAYKASGEALRVTIPSVVLISIIRHKHLAANKGAS